jgi:hypothetical protein
MRMENAFFIIVHVILFLTPLAAWGRDSYSRISKVSPCEMLPLCARLGAHHTLDALGA